MGNEESKERRKLAVVYDIVRRGESSKLKYLVESHFDYKVVREYVDYEEVINARKVLPKLSALLSELYSGSLKVDAVFVRTVNIFRNLDTYLFVKRILDLSGVELRSAKLKERRVYERSVEQLRSKARLDDLRDFATLALIYGSGAYLIYITGDIFFVALALASMVLITVGYYKRVYVVRRHLKEKLSQLMNLNLPRDGSVRFIVTLKGVEVIRS